MANEAICHHLDFNWNRSTAGLKQQEDDTLLFAVENQNI
jgi:hypothetical protein